MQMNISGISIEVQKKKIKNMHLYVKPPDGHVVISAPSRMSNKTIELFARANLEWIREKIKRFEEQPKISPPQYISGEIMYIWGERYTLVFREHSQRNSFVIQAGQVILSMKRESSIEQRERYVREQYRILLKEEIEQLLPKWENITGLYCDSFRTKYMITRWGTCNTNKKRLWFNVQLAQKPIDCLEYIILHELVHLKIRNHGVEFQSAMDTYMPAWREIQKKLNSAAID